MAYKFLMSNKYQTNPSTITLCAQIKQILQLMS